MTSPFFSERTDLLLERPRVARLLIELPVRIRDRFRTHETPGIKIVQCGFAFALFDPFAHPRGINAGIDDQMGDVNIPGTELSRGALCYRAQTEFRARERGVANATAQTGGGAREKDASTPARQHQTRRFACSQKS